MFCAIFSTVTYISDQVTRNALPPLREPDQRSDVCKHPEDTQVQKRATASPKSWEIHGRSADGEVKTSIASCWFWRSSLPSNRIKKLPSIKGRWQQPAS